MQPTRRFRVNTAYGQLVLLVFLPIAVLASVGAVLVFFETHRALKSEQDVLAQAALIRYEPLVRPLLPTLKQNDTLALQATINTLGFNGMTSALIPTESPSTIGRRYIAEQMYRLQSGQHVQRVAILDSQGRTIIGAGFQKDAPWGQFDTTADSVWRLPTEIGTAYGMPIQIMNDGKPETFWLFVDMDNEPFVIATYRIILALAITGLITILLLLLILNLYSKRWIAPIYEMRLHLQRVHANNLGRTFSTRSDGEFDSLQKELNATFRRLNISFKQLKTYSEQTEKDLQQAFDEMEMQNISIREARDLAISSNQAKSAFLANISHELRTPLNAIDGFTNLLARTGTLDAKQGLYVQTIKKSSAHLLALINDVLDFSKMEAGKLVLEHQPFDLYETVYEVADMLSPMALDKGLRMAVQYYQDVPEKIVGDKLRIKQILTNLLGNALKFTDTGGVVIKVALDDEFGQHMDDGQACEPKLVISISDTGRGVDKATQEQLFTSFGQGDASVTRRYGGTGLGLVICKQLVNLMAGEIGFFDNNDANTDKQGATFWFSLPYKQTASDELFAYTPPTFEPIRLLAWINHSPNMHTLKANLALSAVELTQATSLAQLLEMLSHDNYDWVVVDSFGQQGDVTALLRQVRRQYQGKLAILGYEVGLDTMLLDNYGAYALHEPIDRRQLYRLLGNQNEPAKSATVSFLGHTVLAVDDHLPNLLVLEALLSELGVQVVFAQSGFEAIEIISKIYENQSDLTPAFSLIFMDISMPSMSGFTATEAIRKIEMAHGVANIPVVALSAHSLSDEKQALQSAGIDDYATKPISHHELLVILQKWLKDKAVYQDITQDTPKADTALPYSSPSYPSKVDGVIDWQDALDRASNKAELALKLLTMMQDSATGEKTALQQAWLAQDWAVLSDIAHRIVGATRYTGVPILRRCAERFYQSCQLIKQDKSVEWTDAQIIKAQITTEFDELIQALDDLLAVDMTLMATLDG